MNTRLPYEILREIIICASEYIVPGPMAIDEAELEYPLIEPPIIASHVCRSWRYCLLYDPSLWTCVIIPRFKPSGVVEILHRSGSGLLNVFIRLIIGHSGKHYTYFGTSEMLYSLFQQIHRFKFLYTQLNFECYANTPQYADSLRRSAAQVLSYLQQPAPKLKTFRFWYKDEVIPLKDTFPITLFAGKAPNLKCIHSRLFEDFRELQSPLFSNLSELSVTLAFEDLYLEHLLRLVELSPELKFLRIHSDWMDKPMSIYQPDTFRKINLPHLRRFVLEANTTIELVEFFLEYMAFSQDLVWHITFDGWCLTDTPQVEESPHFVEFMARACFPSLHIKLNFNVVVSLTTKEEHCGSKCLKQFDRNKLKFPYDGRSFSVLWESVLYYVKSSSHITYLDLEIERMSDRTLFPDIFKKLKNLEYLRIKKIGSYYHVDFLDLRHLSIFIHGPESTTRVGALEIFTDENMSSDLPTILCPRLRELTLELNEPLSEALALILRACSDSRLLVEEAHPLHTTIYCPGIEEGVESVLGIGINDSIHVVLISVDRDKDDRD